MNAYFNAAFLDYYRCPEEYAPFRLAGRRSTDRGYFRFGPHTICYGSSTAGFLAARPTDELDDLDRDVRSDRDGIALPFSPSEIAANLRYERYALVDQSWRGLRAAPWIREVYYAARPLLPIAFRKHLQRLSLGNWRAVRFPQWPVDTTVEDWFEGLAALSLEKTATERLPFIWFWPDGASSCAAMTHDVETLAGRDHCTQLMDLDDRFEIKSSFQLVPEKRYPVTPKLLDDIRSRGFEINVHDLNHDGRLFSTRERFAGRAARIDRYRVDFGAAGFRSAALYRNLEWIAELKFDYDMSVPNVGHLEAQRGGCCTVMPFFCGAVLEIPVTTTQDYSLFQILNSYSIDLWQRQLRLVGEKHGLASFIIHPDYIRDPKPRQAYTELLAHLTRLRKEERLWLALPRDVNRWWRQRSEMRLIRRGSAWTIDGPGSERARIAYATREGNRVLYQIEPAAPSRAGQTIGRRAPAQPPDNRQLAL